MQVASEAPAALISTGGDSSGSFQESGPPGTSRRDAEHVAEHKADQKGPTGPTGKMMETDEGNQKEAVIALLEDWAAWERSLEEEAEQNDHRKPTKDTASQPAILVENYPLKADTNRPSSSGKWSAEVIGGDARKGAAPPSLREKIASAPHSPGHASRRRHSARRERVRAERSDPAARARRKALKVWTADQTRRISVQSELADDRKSKEEGPSLKEWGALQVRRRSSAEATVDQNRKGASSWQHSDWMRNDVPPLHAIASHEMSPQRQMRQGDESQRPWSPYSTESASLVGRIVSRRPDAHPWRTNMRTRVPEKQGAYASDGIEVREGDAQTAPSTPRSPGSAVAGRASPWASAPSRETAGGILVKHSFFYGSAGRITPRRVATASPSFESQWMRKFRQEVQSNPNWWAGSDQYHPTRSSAMSLRRASRDPESNQRPSRRSSAAASAVGEKDGVLRRADLWQEVRSVLAADRNGGDKRPGDGHGRSDVDHRAAIWQRANVLSFGDRLRYTPLSQGAWLVDRAARAQPESGVQPKDGGISGTSGAERTGSNAAIATVGKSGRTVSQEKVRQEAVGRTHVNNGKTSGRKAGRGEADGCEGGLKRGDGAKKGNLKGFQVAHDVILAQLRGEIDSFTREEIVLRAAEDAKGALARDQLQGISPRRYSCGALRLSPPGHGFSVPDSIDYDKVEATLSLIDLASRAAGPDAGKQMLQALRALDKIHHQVSEDGVAPSERDITKEEKDGLQVEDCDVDRTNKEGEEAAEVEVAVAEHGGPGANVTAALDIPAGLEEAPPPSEGSEGSRRRLSRRASLAISTSSDETMDSASGGVMQSIGNWLWGNDKVPSRSSSFAFGPTDAKVDGEHQQSGHEGFSMPLEEPETGLHVGTRDRERTRADEEDIEERPPASKNTGKDQPSTGRDSAPSLPRGSTDDCDSKGSKSDEAIETAAEHSSVGGGVVEAASASLGAEESKPQGEEAEPPGEEAERQGKEVESQGEEEEPEPQGEEVESQGEEEDSKGEEEDSKGEEEEPKGEATVIPCKETTCSASQTNQWAAPIASPSLPEDVTMENSKPGSSENLARILPPKTDASNLSPVEGERVKTINTAEPHPLAPKDIETSEGMGVRDQHERSTVKTVVHRDSWVSVGTRPQRWKCAAETEPGPRVGRDTVLSKRSIGGNVEGAETTTKGQGGGNGADLRETTASKDSSAEVSSKGCVKYAWPNVGRPCNGKRLCPSSGGSKEKAPSSGKIGAKPGIVRRSPLIDALHPALARQRSFQLQLRQSRERKACRPTDRHTEVLVGLEGSKDKGTRNALEAVEACYPATFDAKTGARQHESASPSLVSPTSPPPRVAKQSRPLAVPTLSEVALAERPHPQDNTDAVSAVAKAGKLTDMQWEYVETWMVHMKSSLGPKVWERLGSSMSFFRARDRFRKSLRPGDEAGIFNRCGQPLPFARPTLAVRGSKRLETSPERQMRGKPSGSPCVWKVARQQAETKEKIESEEQAGGWDDVLSHTVALAVDAVMWTIATERERSTAWAAIARDRNRRSQTAFEVSSGMGRRCGRPEGDDAGTPVTDLGVSLTRARRFIKSSRLTDGVHVLEADVDVALKRWEETERVRETSPIVRALQTGRAGERGPGSRQPGLFAAVRDTKSTSPNIVATPRGCEAVGCSEAARYGDIHPMAKARLCRKHRHNGMVDVGGRRCGRPDCGRLAVGSGPHASAGVGRLCTLHAREGRVDLDGLSFVLLALSEARQKRIRRPEAKLTGAQGDILSEPNGEPAHNAILQASAVRDVLLALTSQSLVRDSLTAERRPGLQSCASREHRGSSIGLRSTHDPIPSTTLSTTTWMAGLTASTTEVPRRRRSRVDPAGDDSKHNGIGSSQKQGECRPLGGHHRNPSLGLTSGAQVNAEGAREEGDVTARLRRKGLSFVSHETAVQGGSSSENGERAVWSPEGKEGEEYFDCQTHDSRPFTSSFLGDDGDVNGGASAAVHSLHATKTGSQRPLQHVDSVDTVWGGIRWKGANQVLRNNAESLNAVFHKYSRSSACHREMTLREVLRFCDAFELRPGLVSTREALDAFKEVVYPGVIGLTDREIGYINPALDPSQGAHSPLPRVLGQPSSQPTVIDSSAECDDGEDIRRELSVFNSEDAGTATAALGEMSNFQEEEDECSLYFRSDSGGEGHIQTPSRPSSVNSRGFGGRRKRTVYLGRSQKFPLRRAESTLPRKASGRSSVLSGVSQANLGGAGEGLQRHPSIRRLSLSQGGTSSRRCSVALDFAAVARETSDPPVAPGLSQDQFFEWLAEVAVGCAGLARTFKHTFARRSVAGDDGRGTNAECDSRLGSGRGVRRGGDIDKQYAARAVVLLQWMEVSRGMRKDGIPPFCLSSHFANGKR